MKTKDDITLAGLQMGMAVPFLYFGTQLLPRLSFLVIAF